MFILPVVPGDKANPPPTSPYQGLDLFGLSVTGIDAVVADLKAEGAEFTMEPNNIRPQPWADLPKVLELARRPNAVIKVSGACTLSREPYPFPDIWDPLARVFDAWGFDRCLWGTDGLALSPSSIMSRLSSPSSRLAA